MSGQMDKKQFAMLSIAIKSAYPASKILEDNASMDFWYKMLQDIDYNVAENAVMEHICTQIYPPNIAEIRKMCMTIYNPTVLNFEEAWGVVQKAISQYGRDNPQEAFATMDELTVSIVKKFGWLELCTSENPIADRANFREVYERKLVEVQKQLQLPKFVAENKQLLQQRYVPVIEKKETLQIEEKKLKKQTKDSLTPEQLEERAKRFDEIKRRVLGGEKIE